jgi:hypothetical protein
VKISHFGHAPGAFLQKIHIDIMQMSSPGRIDHIKGEFKDDLGQPHSLGMKEK